MKQKPEEPVTEDNNPKKRPLNNSVENDAGKEKKIKNFSAKLFRKQLNNQQTRQTALNEFLVAVRDSKKHDYILDYLESGGGCLELLHLLESDSTISPALIFELIHYILLKISAAYHRYQSPAHDACRYLLSNYVSVINKMISFNSTTPERKACLKLLTAIVAFSSNLAKDILINVNFHSANIELLTKHTRDDDSVRDHFIRFLTAFLIDGHYPALSVLLEKKGFITSIISGLQYDLADTLCIVITAMKNHILENSFVSKTAKMKVFNTIVVRDIVNLYNWKGPEGLMVQKKGKNITPAVVNEVDKSKVNECVHDFLLVLCTSHKYGVIFKDHLIGLGKKNQNALMYTVLESLERPWDHSYASELVIKICGACPDLTKTVWINLKPFLELRLTDKWLTAVNFARKLIREVDPSHIEFCVKELNSFQLFQVVQCLIMPLPVLKTILPGNFAFENQTIKQQVMSLLQEILKSLERYLNTFKIWLHKEEYQKFKHHVSNFTIKHFPNSLLVINEWITLDETNFSESYSEYVEMMLDIFGIYKNINPALLTSINSDDIDLLRMLERLEKLCKNPEHLQIKLVNIFIDLDQSKFKPSSDLFAYSINLFLKSYYENKDSRALEVLEKILKNTGIFEGSMYEIKFWINAVFNLKHFDEEVGNNLVEIVKITYENILQLFEELSKIKSESGGSVNSVKIADLEDVGITQGHKVNIKERYCSPMILGLVIFLNENPPSKFMKVYVNFVVMNLLHSQTDLVVVMELISRIECVNKGLKKYMEDWKNCSELTLLPKLKGRMDLFEIFSQEFMTSDFCSFFEKNDVTSVYNDLPLNLLDTGLFYIGNLLKNKMLSSQCLKNFELFVNYLIRKNLITDEFIERILGNSIVFSKISFLKIDEESITFTIVNIVKNILNSGCTIDEYLQVYREKLLAATLKILKKPSKYEIPRFKDILETFNVGYDECCEILKKSENYSKHSQIVFDISIFSIKQITKICEKNQNLKPLQEDVITNLSKYFVMLNKMGDIDVSELSSGFLNYLKIFPHSIQYTDQDLFASIINLDYNKENIQLATFLLERNDDLIKSVRENLENICTKRGVLLPLLKILMEKNVDVKWFSNIYKNFLPSITKALEKPQKAGQHFLYNYEGLVPLLGKFMNVEHCGKFLKKVQKYEVTEVFHVKLLAAIYTKFINAGDLTSIHIHNIVLTFIHLQMNLFKKGLKSEHEVSKIEAVALEFAGILKVLREKVEGKDLSVIYKNEALKLYCKFCLKFGISGQTTLLEILRNLVDVLVEFFSEEDAKLLTEMLLSHSEFLDNVLGEHNVTKLEIWSLFSLLCKNWNGLMERNHIPILLGSYRALVHECDRKMLSLLKMYEKHANQTKFYDFKPFLWGKAAATHYSVKTTIDNALWRQPKTGDVLNILQEDLVKATIIYYPFGDPLQPSDEKKIINEKVYDLAFLLPLFSQLLAPEQQIATYKFTRSGALSLTVVALSSQNKEIRQAACHVLSRFYFHVEARQTGKDNLLWIRYIEAVCKGTAILPDFKLNNFSAIYLARMALILTQPNHVMYVPLSQHLTAKLSLDFNTVPELYTFLHGSDVNYKEHRSFILELLKDGLRNEKDLADLLRSMAFKLFSELYSSSVSDRDSKFLILDIIKVICGVSLGVKVLCENHSLLAQIYTEVDSFSASVRDKRDVFFDKIIDILLEIVKVMTDQHSNFMVFLILQNVFTGLMKNRKKFFEILHCVYSRFPQLIPDDFCTDLLEKIQDSLSNYFYTYDCKYVNTSDFDVNSEYYYLRLLIFDMKKSKLKKSTC